jgi:hypothetical protein
MQSYVFLLAATAVSGTSHSSVPTCACLGQDLGFTIDCKKPDLVDAAYDYLVANCLTACGTDLCKKNWGIVESHHDFCLHDDLEEEVEKGFHVLEEVCPKICSIGRMKDDAHVECPASIPGMPGVACPDVDYITGVVSDLYDLDCATTCTNANGCGDAFKKLKVIHDNCPNFGAKSFEWAGIFPIADASTTWLMQGKTASSPPGETMWLAFVPVEANEITAAKLKALESEGDTLGVGTCTDVDAGGAATVIPATGSCFNLKPGSAADASFLLDTTALVGKGVAIYAQHVPLEFERDTHFFFDSTGAVGTEVGYIEPSFWSRYPPGGWSWEWAGVFPISGTSTTWLMQKVDGAYADPSMTLVLLPTTTPTYATLQASLTSVYSDMLGGDCTVVAEGGSITPVAEGSCFNLTVDDAKTDSTFVIDTTGLTGLVVFAQHGPTEFERDLHYLYDTAKAVGADTNSARDDAGANVEPIAQEGGGGGGHAHGHRRLSATEKRRLLDVDAALHDFEDACNAVGCYIPVTGASCKVGDSPDLFTTTVSDLQARASAKCFVTPLEASCCPSKPETCEEAAVADDTSGVKRGAALTGVMILLISAMQ